jgi:hypothetical protein
MAELARSFAALRRAGFVASSVVLIACEFLISEEDVLGARHSSGASFSLFAAPHDASLE